MRSRTPLFALLFAVGFFALPHLAHASIPFFGPIIPGSDIPGNINAVCPAGWGMLMDVINRIIELLLTIAIVFVTPLMLAYAGFLYVVNPFDPSGISKAKSILINTIVGIVIALAGWMIVDAIMAALYNASAPGLSGISWSSLITSSGPACLPQKGALPTDVLKPTTVTPGVTVVPPTTPGVIVVPPGAGTSKMNIAAAVAHLDASAASSSSGYCWQYVRQAILAGGLTSFTANGTAAKDAGPLLTQAGFTTIGSDNSSPQAGDVVIIQNYPGGSAAGHAAMYDGSKWVSDFVQTDFWGGPGYRSNQSAHTFYRP